jgi:mRNA interferase MazF
VSYIPRRGDVIFIDFTPEAGHEQAGKRPALVLSPLEYNRRTGRVLACPMTNATSPFPWAVPIPANDNVSGFVLADQIRTLDWKARHAAFFCTPDWAEVLVEEVIARLQAILEPDDEEEDE